MAYTLHGGISFVTAAGQHDTAALFPGNRLQHWIAILRPIFSRDQRLVRRGKLFPGHPATNAGGREFEFLRAGIHSQGRYGFLLVVKY
jgi:hypothetical protein